MNHAFVGDKLWTPMNLEFVGVHKFTLAGILNPQ